VKTAALAESAQSCCAQHGTPLTAPAEKQDAPPCRSECCRVSPFVLVAEKVLVDAPPLALAGAIPQIVALPVRPLELPSAVLAEAPPLQILHCQWRL